MKKTQGRAAKKRVIMEKREHNLLPGKKERQSDKDEENREKDKTTKM